MNNNRDFDLNQNPPSPPPNVTPPSNNQTPKIKRTRTSNKESSSSSGRKPAKKPDPNAPLITEPCKVCGKKFWSSKALHGHMRSHPERQWRGINPPPNHQPFVPTAPPFQEGQVLAIASTTGSSVGVECGGCKKVFESRQALDGHLCSAIINLNEDPHPPSPLQQEIVDESNSVVLVSGMNHRCDICSKVFTSGQALGGHMRSHWHKERKEKKQASTSTATGIDLNVPASSTNVPGSSSTETLPDSSLDLRLRL